MNQLPATMHAVVIEEPGELKIQELPLPAPGKDQVLVRVALCGICGTDLHVMSGEYSPVRYPVIVGHEFTGTIVAVGEGVDPSRVGGRVVVDPSLYCGNCEFCLNGRDNLCENGGGLGTTADGAAAEFISVDADLTYDLPDTVPFEDAVLVEPLACVMHAFELLNGTPLGNCLVYGAGTMGLLVAAVAKARGATTVSVVDRDPDRLIGYEELHIDSAATSAADLTHSTSGWETVIDCTGAIPAIEDAVRSVRRGGKYLQFGVPDPGETIALNPFRLFKEEITLTGSRAVRRNFPEAIALLASGTIPFSNVVTTVLQLSDYEEGLSQLTQGKGRKIVIDVRNT